MISDVWNKKRLKIILSTDKTKTPNVSGVFSMFYDLTFFSNSLGYMYEPSIAKKVPSKIKSA